MRNGARREVASNLRTAWVERVHDALTIQRKCHSLSDLELLKRIARDRRVHTHIHDIERRSRDDLQRSIRRRGRNIRWGEVVDTVSRACLQGNEACCRFRLPLENRRR